jgi:ribosomal protein S12 methylthiotransferase
VSEKKKISLISLGCSKNLVDSEFLVGGLKQESYTFVDEPKDSDIVIVNTCGFLDKAREE